jgi:hypothetical protein
VAAECSGLTSAESLRHLHRINQSNVTSTDMNLAIILQRCNTRLSSMLVVTFLELEWSCYRSPFSYKLSKYPLSSPEMSDHMDFMRQVSMQKIRGGKR